MSKRSRWLYACLLVVASQVACREALPEGSGEPDVASVEDGPGWLVLPSFKYDVLCLFNVLTADSFYVRYYGPEHEYLEPLMTEVVREAVERIERSLKLDGGGIVSAVLTLNLSVVPDSTLTEMADVVRDTSRLRRGLADAGFYSASDWARFVAVREDVRTVLLWLDEIDYRARWERETLPGLQTAAADLVDRLPPFPLAEHIERLTGVAQAPGPVTVFVLRFNQPHGIRIVGRRYLTYAGWPVRIVLNDAIHELLHPPYDLDAQPRLADAIDRLAADTFLMDRVENHDPSLGYNTLRGLVEEDVVQAVEQLLAETMGIEDDPVEKWESSDEGIHVFAAGLYHILERDGWLDSGEPVGDVLLRELSGGELSPGRVRETYRAFLEDRRSPPGP